jgi:hypothetical protein
MRKSDLISECTRRGLETWGTIPVLKARLAAPPIRNLSKLDKSNFFYESLQKLFNREIICIENVLNPVLEQRFLNRLSELTDRDGLCEIIVAFHGTNCDAIASIVEHGFDSSKSKRQLYGAGTYFARDPSVSMLYAQQSHKLILCEVLSGDAVVDTKNKPGIFVVSNNCGTIPRCVVTYR